MNIRETVELPYVQHLPAWRWEPLQLQRTDPASSQIHDARFRLPGQIGGLKALGNGSIMIAHSTSGQILCVEPGAISAKPVHPVGGELDSADRPLTSPMGLAVATDGTLFVTDTGRHRICAIAPDGSIRVVAGEANGYRDGAGNEAMFSGPLDITIAPDGACLVADTGNDRIRRITQDGMVSTAAGSIYDYGDGYGPEARFRRPSSLAVGVDGSVLVADTGNHVIRRIDPEGMVTTVAGNPSGGDCDGRGEEIGLQWPTGIDVGADGSLWIADHGNGAVRRLDLSGECETVLRLSGRSWPTVLSVAESGSVLIAYTEIGPGNTPASAIMTIRKAA